MNLQNIHERISFSFDRGSAKDDPTKAVTPMIYYNKVIANDGVVVILGVGWWHWYANFRIGYVD